LAPALLWLGICVLYPIARVLVYVQLRMGREENF
jgi:hypothetical protein